MSLKSHYFHLQKLPLCSMFRLWKETFIQLPPFSRLLADLIKKKKISDIDFENFEQELAKNPTSGDVIPGLSGLRKIRLKGANIGKRDLELII